MLKVSTVEPDITLATIEGRMNLGSNLMFLEGDLKKLVESGTRKLVVDMAGVDYIDSAGIGVLVGTAGLLRQVGGEMKLIGPQQRVADIFKMVRVHLVLPIMPDLKSAVASFSGSTTSGA
jgi:anti-sigma B factor antagonist